MRLIHGIVQGLLKSPRFLGRDYLIVNLPRWFIKKAEGPVIVSTRFGFKIKVDPTFDENIEKVIYKRGVYELGTVDLIQSLLAPGDLFIDVGANIGFMSLVAADKVGKSGKVLAFEPVPSTYDLLIENKELNGFDQIKAHPFALGSSCGQSVIYEEEQNRGGASIVIERSEAGIEIEINTLDELMPVQAVKLVKIDVEGFEFEVLKGAEQLIRRDHPSLIVEFSKDRGDDNSSIKMFQWLKDLKVYEFYRLKHGKERKSKLIKVISKTGGLPEHDNIICLPKEK